MEKQWGLVRQLTWCRCTIHQRVRRALKRPTNCRPFRSSLQVPYKNEAFHLSIVPSEWALVRCADWKLTVSNKEKFSKALFMKLLAGLVWLTNALSFHRFTVAHSPMDDSCRNKDHENSMKTHMSARNWACWKDPARSVRRRGTAIGAPGVPQASPAARSGTRQPPRPPRRRHRPPRPPSPCLRRR